MKPKRPILFVHSGHELYGADKMFILNIRAAKEKYPDKKIVVILPKKGPLSEVLYNEFGIKVLVKRIGVLRKYDIKRFNFSFLERVLTFFRLIQYLNKFDLVFINTIVIADYIIAAHFIKSKVIVHVHELPVGMASIVFTK